MTITNESNLPQALVDACSCEMHNKEGCVSATTLKNGVREILLTKRHWEDMSFDVSDRVFLLFGTAVHALLERESADTFVEEKFEQQVGKYKVTGRLDCYDMKNGIIVDYKTATVWKYKFADYADWRFQGLVYAWLLKQQGLEVKECQFVMMFKDFSKTKCKLEPDYPKRPVEVYKFKVTEKDLEEIEQKITAKVKALEENENVSDDELPLCTDEERWAKPTTYAVMKKGRKSAIRVFNNREDAEMYSEQVAGDFYIVERKGADGKCNGYCGCCEFCNYYKEHYEEQSYVEDGIE